MSETERLRGETAFIDRQISRHRKGVTVGYWMLGIGVALVLIGFRSYGEYGNPIGFLTFVGVVIGIPGLYGVFSSYSKIRELLAKREVLQSELRRHG